MIAKQEYDRQYRQTKEYRESQRKYMRSRKGKVARKEYYLEHKEKYQKYQKEYKQSEKGKINIEKYTGSDKGKQNAIKHVNKRKRNLGFNKLIENDWDCEVNWHHVNDNDVVPIPRNLHQMCPSSNSKEHRRICNKLVNILYEGELKL